MKKKAQNKTGAVKYAAKPGKRSSGKKVAAAGKVKSSRKVAAAPLRQSAPSAQRYMEIQQALAASGHYTGPVNGTWDDNCVAALRAFQAEQNLNPDGKLGALSLIALGLGPKREPLQLPLSQVLSKPDSTTPE